MLKYVLSQYSHKPKITFMSAFVCLKWDSLNPLKFFSVYFSEYVPVIDDSSDVN